MVIVTKGFRAESSSPKKSKPSLPQLVSKFRPNMQVFLAQSSRQLLQHSAIQKVPERCHFAEMLPNAVHVRKLSEPSLSKIGSEA